MKNIRILILVLALIVLMSTSAFAIVPGEDSVSGNNLSKITYEKVLNKASGILEAAKFSGDFKELEMVGTYYLGDSIPAYESISTELKEVNTKYYPVFRNETIIGTIIARVAGTEEIVLEYVDVLADDLDAKYKNNQDVCLIFDKDYAWIYSEIGAKNVKMEVFENTNRGSLDLESNDVMSIEKSSIKRRFPINYDGTIEIAGSVSNGKKTLSVPVKTQISGSSYCWACTAASIGQFKTGTTLNAQSIAREYAGDLYTPKPISTIKKVLSEKCGLSSTIKNLSLKMSVTQTCIKANNPIATYVRYTISSGHFIVVRGYYVSNASSTGTYYVYIMDPLSGNRTLEVSSNAIDREVLYYSPTGSTEYTTTMYLKL